MALGVNNAILFLIAVVAVVQGGLVALFISFYRRAKNLDARRAKMTLIDGGAR